MSKQDEALCAGQAALLRAAWLEARVQFEAALTRGETPQALEGIGAAAWWLSDAPAVFAARERAYRLYRESGEDRNGARIATALAMDYCTFRGRAAIARGWVRRAERLLGDEICRELGWLLIVKTHIALMIDHDPATTRDFATRAGSLGEALGDVDLEMLALAYEGLALVSLGQVDAGMRCLDEAVIAAAAGEMSDIDATCTACCLMIYACEKARDLERAAEWCAQLKERSARSSYRLMFALCRAHYAGVLIRRGAWTEAESKDCCSVPNRRLTRCLSGSAVCSCGELWLLNWAMPTPGVITYSASCARFRRRISWNALRDWNCWCRPM
jgi:LuxR family maltose regulon positive regulatory protein